MDLILKAKQKEIAGNSLTTKGGGKRFDIEKGIWHSRIRGSVRAATKPMRRADGTIEKKKTRVQALALALTGR